MSNAPNDSHDSPVSRVELHLPPWLVEWCPSGRVLPSLDERMDFVAELAERNVRHRSGGPFGAAVVELESGRLVAAGVNVVLPSGCFAAHAEVMALALAERALGLIDLGSDGRARQLVTSVEPCAMCLGAVCWSGVRQVVCGARGEDAEACGFDEGPKDPHWPEALRARGVSVVRDVLRERAAQTLRAYVASGGPIYNAATRTP